MEADAWVMVPKLNKDKTGVVLEINPLVTCGVCARRGTYSCPVYRGGDGMCSRPDEWFCGDGERGE